MSLNQVLVVEDTPADQFMAKAVFRRALGDVEVVTVFDGVEALEVLQEENIDPDVILLDINMPRMGGIEFLEEYANRGGTKTPPVVVMLTSSDQESDKSVTSQYSCVKEYFLKPLRKEDVHKLQELVGGLE